MREPLPTTGMAAIFGGDEDLGTEEETEDASSVAKAPRGGSRQPGAG